MLSNFFHPFYGGSTQHVVLYPTMSIRGSNCLTDTLRHSATPEAPTWAICRFVEFRTDLDFLAKTVNMGRRDPSPGSYPWDVRHASGNLGSNRKPPSGNPMDRKRMTSSDRKSLKRRMETSETTQLCAMHASTYACRPGGQQLLANGEREKSSTHSESANG